MAAEPEPEPTRDLYALLHLSPDASDEDIRKAYRQWAQIYHPDKYLDQHVIEVLVYIFSVLLSAH
jgi:DnaJ homolog subfamily C member 11